MADTPNRTMHTRYDKKDRCQTFLFHKLTNFVYNVRVLMSIEYASYIVYALDDVSAGKGTALCTRNCIYCVCLEMHTICTFQCVHIYLKMSTKSTNWYVSLSCRYLLIASGVVRQTSPSHPYLCRCQFDVCTLDDGLWQPEGYFKSHLAHFILLVSCC